VRKDWEFDAQGRKIDWRYLAREAPFNEIASFLLGFDSYRRTVPMAMLMHLAAIERSEHCIRIFLDSGNFCDDPWACRSTIAAALRQACGVVNLPDLLDPRTRETFMPHCRA
jgi:hypothetical protein